MTEPGRRREDGFYVGYLPMPSRHARFLRVVVPALSIAIFIAGVLMVWRMRDPGPAVWDAGADRSWTGRLAVSPYPILFTQDDALLVVAIGKASARPRLESHDGRLVRLRGHLLQRNGLRMIELAQDEGAIKRIASEAPGQIVRPVALGRRALSGQIVDGKCFLGAMKPGDGKAHKACAALCIRGGLPPLLAVPRSDGRHECWLLLDEDGGPMPAALLARVAEPITLIGEAAQLGPLRTLRIRDE